jgi:copper chaperone CopZ
MSMSSDKVQQMREQMDVVEEELEGLKAIQKALKQLPGGIVDVDYYYELCAKIIKYEQLIAQAKAIIEAHDAIKTQTS